jgi:hypothetical protein
VRSHLPVGLEPHQRVSHHVDQPALRNLRAISAAHL